MKKHFGFIGGLIIFLLVFAGMPIRLAAGTIAPDSPTLDRDMVFAMYRKGGTAGGIGGPGPDPCDPNNPSKDCPHYISSGYKWDAEKARNGITVYIDPQEKPAELEWTAIWDAAQKAFKTWDDQSAGIKFAVLSPWAGPSGCARNQDTYNCIGFKDTTVDELAHVHPYRNFLGWGPELIEADMLIDTVIGNDNEWTTDFIGKCPPYNYFDLQNVITHEAGHYLSLNDLDGAGEKLLTMYGNLSNDVCKTTRRQLGIGDILGIKALYGN